MVPMHLELIKGSLCPIIEYQLRGSLFLLKFQVAPRLQRFISSGPQKKQICIFFLSEKSQKMNSLHVPKQVPYAERLPFTGLVYISLKFIINISLNKEMFSLLSNALVKERTFIFRMETDAHFKSLIYHTFRDPQ